MKERMGVVEEFSARVRELFGPAIDVTSQHGSDHIEVRIKTGEHWGVTRLSHDDVYGLDTVRAMLRDLLESHVAYCLRQKGFE